MAQQQQQLPSQVFGTLNWAKEMLAATYITPGSSVLEWHTDGNHVGKVARTGCASLIVTGPNRAAVSNIAARAAQRGPWRVTSAALEPGPPGPDGSTTKMPRLPAHLKTQSLSCVVSFTTGLAEVLGDDGAAEAFLSDMREALSDNGVFAAVLPDSGSIYRRAVLDDLTRGEVSNRVMRVKVREGADSRLFFSLAVRDDSAGRLEAAPLYNLTTVLRAAEAAGFEVLECTNLLDVLYTQHAHPQWATLLGNYQVLDSEKRPKVLPEEKLGIEMFTTLALRKRSRTPAQVWQQEASAFQAMQRGGAAPMCPSPEVPKEASPLLPDGDSFDGQTPWG